MLLPGPPPFTTPASCSSTFSHAHILDRLYDKKATAAEARLRTQVRLRARLAAERRLVRAHDQR
jgi:hypothetical protein